MIEKLLTMHSCFRNHTMRPARKLVRSGINGEGGEKKGVERQGERIHNRRRKRKKNLHERTNSAGNRRRHGENGKFNHIFNYHLILKLESFMQTG